MARPRVFAWFEQLTLREGGAEARSLLGLCDRYYLLTHILGRADMLWHGDPGESVPARRARLALRALPEVEGQPGTTGWTCGPSWVGQGRPRTV